MGSLHVLYIYLFHEAFSINMIFCLRCIAFEYKYHEGHTCRRNHFIYTLEIKIIQNCKVTKLMAQLFCSVYNIYLFHNSSKHSNVDID